MRRVTVIGSECTGKTTLVEWLSAELGAPRVPEYSRTYAQAVSRDLTADDVEPIARGQMALDDAATGPLVLRDTDLLSTVVYARHYYGECPAWIVAEARARAASLYLLADIDVPWVADPQRDRPHLRPLMHGLFRDVLGEFGVRWVSISGPWAERRRRAVEALSSRA